ncbi:MAG: phosphotransferase, partial [Chloroflexi bacterium]|nr:phosphotransferase [Chloroflexota bacterium]
MEPETIARLDQVLAAYLAYRLPEVEDVRVSNVVRSTGGASRSQWFFDVSWRGEAPVSKTLTLRASECTCFRDSESSLEREYRIFKALEGSPVPVPRNYWYEDDPRWLGEPFVIRERIEARTSFAGEPPETKRRIIDHFVEILAAQHSMDWRKMGLSFLGASARTEDCALELVET